MSKQIKINDDFTAVWLNDERTRLSVRFVGEAPIAVVPYGVDAEGNTLTREEEDHGAIDWPKDEEISKAVGKKVTFKDKGDDSLEGIYGANPANRPRTNPNETRVAKSYRVAPETAKAIDEAAKATGKSAGQILDGRVFGSDYPKLRAKISGEFDRAAAKKLRWPIAWNGAADDEGETALHKLADDILAALDENNDALSVTVVFGEVVSITV